MDTSSFSLPSFAKINWNLQILGRRPDGYHEVRTLLQTISLQDQIHFERAADDELSLSTDSFEVPTDETNLILRAAASLRNLYGVKSGARISLTKRIPVKAGLGGGSSNAAVALIGLCRLWNTDTNTDELMKIAATLGADVPFFLVGGCALGTGRGSTIRPLPDSTVKHLLIITPRVSVSTANAYEALRSTALTSLEPKSILAVSREQSLFRDSDPWAVSENLVNDFEQVIFDMEPEIARAKNALLAAGAHGALLAGSGSSVFGIFDSLQEQQKASKSIVLESGWRTFACVTMSRNDYSRAVSS